MGLIFADLTHLDCVLDLGCPVDAPPADREAALADLLLQLVLQGELGARLDLERDALQKNIGILSLRSRSEIG